MLKLEKKGEYKSNILRNVNRRFVFTSLVWTAGPGPTAPNLIVYVMVGATFTPVHGIVTLMSGEIKLLCWILGDDLRRVFAVRVKSNDFVTELKVAIKAKKESLQLVEPATFKAWKVSEIVLTGALSQT
jgi:hypothetical protein